MVEGGLTMGTGGNVSGLDRESGRIVITPSAVPYDRMREEDLVVVDLGGRIVEGKWKPSNETPMHTLFYRERPDIGAVVHTHAPYTSVFAVTGESVPLVIMEAALAIGRPVAVAPYRRPTTEELGRIALETMDGGVAVILAQHGLITVGSTLEQAFASSEAAEFSARLTLMARSAGYVPRQLDQAEVDVLRRSYLEKYKPSAAGPED
jgi:L-ribulose-5-phosphate 4-epimerase